LPLSTQGYINKEDEKYGSSREGHFYRQAFKYLLQSKEIKKTYLDFLFDPMNYKYCNIKLSANSFARLFNYPLTYS
jgi:hypothetical protein